MCVCVHALQGNVITPTVSGLRQWQQVFNWWASPTTPIPSVDLVKATSTILGRVNTSSVNVFLCVCVCAFGLLDSSVVAVLCLMNVCLYLPLYVVRVFEERKNMRGFAERSVFHTLSVLHKPLRMASLVCLQVQNRDDNDVNLPFARHA